MNGQSRSSPPPTPCLEARMLCLGARMFVFWDELGSLEKSCGSKRVTTTKRSYSY